MTKLLIFKERLRTLYSTKSMYIIPAVKFILALISLLVMNHYIGYTDMLKNPIVSVLIAAVCSMLPLNIIVVICSLVMSYHMYGIAAEIALVVVLVYIIMYLFYFRFSSKYGYVLLLMPILFFFKMPFIMPLMIGIAMSPAAIIAMVFGCIVFFMMQYGSKEAILIINEGTKDSGVDKASAFISDLLHNKEMMIMIIAFVITALVVYGIKRLSIDHSITIGITVGGIFEAIIILCATYILEINGIFKIWMICVCSLLSILIVYVLQFFVLAVDYSRTEYTQFEDDDYYYYVKAVPKIKVTATDVKVKHINVKKSRRN